MHGYLMHGYFMTFRLCLCEQEMYYQNYDSYIEMTHGFALAYPKILIEFVFHFFLFGILNLNISLNANHILNENA